MCELMYSVGMTGRNIHWRQEHNRRVHAANAHAVRTSIDTSQRQGRRRDQDESQRNPDNSDRTELRAQVGSFEVFAAVQDVDNRNCWMRTELVVVVLASCAAADILSRSEECALQRESRLGRRSVEERLRWWATGPCAGDARRTATLDFKASLYLRWCEEYNQLLRVYVS